MIRKMYSYICDNIKMMFQGIRQIVDSASSQGYKSNATKPLIAIIIILFLSSAIPFYFKHAAAGFVVLGIAIVFSIAYLVAYFYCLFKNPDLLRSERFILEKTAIDKVQISGDSSVGRITLPQRDYVLVESASTNPTIETGEEN